MEDALVDAVDEPERILAWRTLTLLRLGFDWPEATALAAGTIDTHDLERLISKGATPKQALEIVA